ncbi:hypothetical protein K432DRAFT_442540 [Lepidopterella palustris CBS 459.81]|uniref:Phospholipid/glycerol acyltransferase domain-containing protein n=1 Tax=Lepidopterella palustris CBS 459.81 TaxID=1314670 RepID=A0A8E2EBW2_9PEZI|nr:hypothetical protein K432DRAFT_442540 [Lepidopterella palustris CBS 459.81]
MAPKLKETDLGAGLNVSKKNVENHPAGPPKHGELSQAERAFTLASTFLSGVLAISATQFLGAPLKLIDPAFYDGYMAYTKESFAILITCLTQWWAPTILYSDWLYLWWIAYTNSMHGYIYIILKESLKNIPILGWGAQFYNFIFLARNWEKDKPQFQRHLQKLNKAKDPMWLLIFPEGTNLSQPTRESSKRWADKNGLQDMKHQLLPRSTGLRFCLQELKETTGWLYDCTIAYEGVPPGQFGQDIFTLRSSFFEGRPPKSVNMHWRRFHVDSIPIDNPKSFDVWLRNRWREKDYMLEYFNRNGRFPADDYWKEQLDMSDTSSGSHSIRSVPRAARTIETQVKSGKWNEFVKIFAPITSVMMALTLAHGASPSDLPVPGGTEFIQQHMSALLGAGDATMKDGPPSLEEMDKLIEGAAKMSATQTADPRSQDKVRNLTQEHLAQLVKESAIKNGVVFPGQKRKAASTVGAVKGRPRVMPRKNAPAKAKSVANLQSTSKPKPPVKPAAVAPKAKQANSGPMQTAMTKTGIPIQVTASQANQVKSGGTIMTSSGVPIHITRSTPSNTGKQQVSTGSQITAKKIVPKGSANVQSSRIGSKPIGTQKYKIVSSNPMLDSASQQPTPQKVVSKQAVQQRPPNVRGSVQKSSIKSVASQANGTTSKPATAAKSNTNNTVLSGPQKMQTKCQPPKKLTS